MSRQAMRRWPGELNVFSASETVAACKWPRWPCRGMGPTRMGWDWENWDFIGIFDGDVHEICFRDLGCNGDFIGNQRW